jgi:chemotaxis protein methyltransferase CheR
LETTGLLPDIYLSRVDSQEKWFDEETALAQSLTVTETYFFRNVEQFGAFRDLVPYEPTWICGTDPSLRILSAGCSSGEEVYSLAIILREQLDRARLPQVQLHGVDVNPSMLERARGASYSAWSLRETTAEIQRRWFQQHGRTFVLDESIRNMVTFEQRNLIEDAPTFWRSAAFHCVFCRNVLMYFTPEQAQSVVARIARSLVPGGFLFLGHAETLRGLSQDFRLLHTHGTFYYQRNDVVGKMSGEPIRRAGGDVARPSLASCGTLFDGESWAEAIWRATERVKTLTDSPWPHRQASDVTDRCVRESTPQRDVGPALQLLQSERFVEALDLVSGLAPKSDGDVELCLLRAVLMVHSGRLDEAAESCQQLLVRDGMNAGAHYLLALCHESTGDRRSATEHDQIAVYLDPGFSMAWLHLGLLSRRSGDRDAASRGFRQAMALLHREDASRLLLFGGGFGREALISLCRSELAACGEDP